MNTQIDPKELKILSDILALVLEDESGQSTTALETIKKRAKRNTITGGALKNLFQSIANDPPKRERTASTARRKKTSSTNPASNDLLEARSRITELTQGINHLDSIVRDLRQQNTSLRSELLLTQKSRAEIQSDLNTIEMKSSFRMILIVISLICGLLCGIAGTVLVHNLSISPPSNNTIYLR